jgi:hypothetical protein
MIIMHLAVQSFEKSRVIDGPILQFEALEHIEKIFLACGDILLVTVAALQRLESSSEAGTQKPQSYRKGLVIPFPCRYIIIAEVCLVCALFQRCLKSKVSLSIKRQNSSCTLLRWDICSDPVPLQCEGELDVFSGLKREPVSTPQIIRVFGFKKPTVPNEINLSLSEAQHHYDPILCCASPMYKPAVQHNLNCIHHISPVELRPCLFPKCFVRCHQ